VIRQISGQRPSIHQIPPIQNVGRSRSTQKRAESIVDKRHKAQTTNRDGHGTVWTEEESTRQQNGLGQLGPTPGRAGPLRMHNVHFSGTNHSPIYMFAYVVCPNLEAAAVLSKRRKTCTLNEMNLPNVAVQSEFETVRNEFTHSATDGHLCSGGRHGDTFTARAGVGHPLCNRLG
jgi:hypothetical protein